MSLIVFNTNYSINFLQQWLLILSSLKEDSDEASFSWLKNGLMTRYGAGTNLILKLPPWLGRLMDVIIFLVHHLQISKTSYRQNKPVCRRGVITGRPYIL
jgi:hypothetical protein